MRLSIPIIIASMMAFLVTAAGHSDATALEVGPVPSDATATESDTVDSADVANGQTADPSRHLGPETPSVF